MVAHQDGRRRGYERGGMFGDQTSKGPLNNTSSMTFQTSKDVQAIEVEPLAITQNWIRKYPPVSKGTYPLVSLGWAHKPTTPG